MQLKYDVIVVGGGGSGLAAACSAAENGGRIVLLEKQQQLGGTTGIAVGSYTASGTAFQKQAGITDDPAAHAEDVRKFAAAEFEERNNEALRSFFLAQAADTLDWLRGMGLSFHGPSPEPPNRVPRMHNVVPGAKAYIAALQTRLQALGGETVCGCHVTGLIRDGDRVSGVRATVDEKQCEFHAEKGVVLAAGDYSSSPELIAKYKGEEFKLIEGINPHADGDGQRLVQEAGGTLVNMDITYGPELRFVAPSRRPFQQVLPTGRRMGKLMAGVFGLLPKKLQALVIKSLLVTWQHPENALFDNGAILINRHGERFTNELASPEREIAVASQPGKECFILLDGRLVQRYSAWPHFISTAPDIVYAYVADYVRLRPDVAVQAPSLTEVAANRGIDGAKLQQTVDFFNRYVTGEQTDPFGRKNDMDQLESSPWVLLGPAKAYFTTTEGGAMINQQFQVLDKNGAVIPGLYAVGQNGLGGMVLWGHGLHIAWAMTSGRLAGKEIMHQV